MNHQFHYMYNIFEGTYQPSWNMISNWSSKLAFGYFLTFTKTVRRNFKITDKSVTFTVQWTILITK
jgi:hypothetical protein